MLPAETGLSGIKRRQVKFYSANTSAIQREKRCGANGRPSLLRAIAPLLQLGATPSHLEGDHW